MIGEKDLRIERLRKVALKQVQKDEIINLLQNLVQIPSRNPPGEEKEVAEFIYKKMKSWGFEAELIPLPFPHRPQTVAIYKGTKNHPKLVLNGHIDTVPEGDRARWSHDPFAGRLKDSKLYGRGACDMKGGLTAMMIAAKIVRDLGLSLSGDLILQFVVGEETGEPGTKSLLLDRGIVGNWGIVLEPTNLKVATAEKGLAWFDVTIRGRQAHASTPELGINAIDKAVNFIGSLRKYRNIIKRRKNPLVGNARCTVTMMQGGIKANIIPESCFITLDRRLLPSEQVVTVEEEIRNILLQMEIQDPEFKWEIKRLKVYEAAEIPRSSEIARIMRKNVEEITGEMPEPYGTAFSTDVRNFINDAKMPAITWGPGDPGIAHTFDEYIDVKQIVNSVKILVLTIIDLLS